jgi:hypothetical protein
VTPPTKNIIGTLEIIDDMKLIVKIVFAIYLFFVYSWGGLSRNDVAIITYENAAAQRMAA